MSFLDSQGCNYAKMMSGYNGKYLFYTVHTVAGDDLATQEGMDISSRGISQKLFQ